MNAQRILALLNLVPLALGGLGGGAWNLIRAIPTFISLAREVMKFLHEFQDYRERVEKLRQLRNGIQASRAGDPSQLTALFNGKASDATPPAPPQP